MMSDKVIHGKYTHDMINLIKLFSLIPTLHTFIYASISSIVCYHVW